MDEQLLRYADSVVRDNRPYSDLLTGRQMEVNGPITHFLKHLTHAPGNALLVTGAQGYDLPEDLGHHQFDEWRSAPRNGDALRRTHVACVLDQVSEQSRPSDSVLPRLSM